MMYDSSDRGLVSIARATAIAAALCFAVAAPLRAADQPSTNTPAMTPAPAAAPTKDNAAATPAAVAPAAAASAATGPTKHFTEDDVNAAVKKVIDERTKEGAFVFRDPKLNADLHLIFDQIKNVRGMNLRVEESLRIGPAGAGETQGRESAAGLALSAVLHDRKRRKPSVTEAGAPFRAGSNRSTPGRSWADGRCLPP